METKKLTKEQVELLNQPLPKEALKPHPTRKYLSVINAIFVTERLNKVFGVGAWQVRTEFVAIQGKMVVTKTIFDVPDYCIHYECYGGNDNADLGDAYKGSTTDAITKIGSYLGIGAHVWKNDPYPTVAPSKSDLRSYIANCDTLDDIRDLAANWGKAIKADAELTALAAERQREIKEGGAA